MERKYSISIFTHNIQFQEDHTSDMTLINFSHLLRCLLDVPLFLAINYRVQWCKLYTSSPGNEPQMAGHILVPFWLIDKILAKR